MCVCNKKVVFLWVALQMLTNIIPLYFYFIYIISVTPEMIIFLSSVTWLVGKYSLVSANWSVFIFIISSRFFLFPFWSQLCVLFHFIFSFSFCSSLYSLTFSLCMLSLSLSLYILFLSLFNLFFSLYSIFIVFCFSFSLYFFFFCIVVFIYTLLGLLPMCLLCQPSLGLLTNFVWFSGPQLVPGVLNSPAFFFARKFSTIAFWLLVAVSFLLIFSLKPAPFFHITWPRYSQFSQIEVQ